MFCRSFGPSVPTDAFSNSSPRFIVRTNPLVRTLAVHSVARQSVTIQVYRLSWVHVPFDMLTGAGVKFSLDQTPPILIFAVVFPDLCVSEVGPVSVADVDTCVVVSVAGVANWLHAIPCTLHSYDIVIPSSQPRTLSSCIVSVKFHSSKFVVVLPKCGIEEGACRHNDLLYLHVM